MQVDPRVVLLGRDGRDGLPDLLLTTAVRAPNDGNLVAGRCLPKVNRPGKSFRRTTRHDQAIPPPSPSASALGDYAEDLRVFQAEGTNGMS